jgi:hypothetical protein
MDNITIKAARDKIYEAVQRDGPYSHNIISLVLGRVAKFHGKKTANKLIDEFELEALGWHKVEG